MKSVSTLTAATIIMAMATSLRAEPQPPAVATIADDNVASVLYYSFDEKEDTAADKSGKGNHGKVHEAQPTSDRFGKPGKALMFNGANAYVSTPHSPTLDTKDAMTVALWVRPADTSRTLYGCLAAKYEWYYGKMSWLLWYRPDHKDLGFTAYGPKQGSPKYSLYSESKLSSSQWSHIVAVFKSGHVQIFLNGRLEAEKRIGYERLSPAPGVPFTIGWIRGGTGKHFFEGALDDVMLYNRALSNQEIKQLYNSQKSSAY